MKKIYLRYNEILQDCILSEGKTYDTKRFIKNLRGQDIIDELKQIDSKRSTELYLKEIPTELEEDIKKMFKGTKIIVKDIEEFI